MDRHVVDDIPTDDCLDACDTRSCCCVKVRCRVRAKRLCNPGAIFMFLYQGRIMHFHGDAVIVMSAAGGADLCWCWRRN